MIEGSPIVPSPAQLPYDGPIQAKYVPPGDRAAKYAGAFGEGVEVKRFTCHAATPYPTLYFVAASREEAVALYRRMHGLDYLLHVHVFVNALED